MGHATTRIAFTILGEPCSKANARQLVEIEGRRCVIKSTKALAYQASATLQIPHDARAMFTGPVRVTLRMFYASERPDLDESLLLDVMQAQFTAGGARNGKLTRMGVYVNDRQVREKHVYHGIDAKRPRVEVEVEEVAP